MTTAPLSEAMMAVADMMTALGRTHLNQHIGPAIHDVDEHWRVVLNPHREFVRYGEKAEIEIPPFSCYIEFNGWPAGLINPYGGAIAAGSLANEETFIAAVKAATQRATEATS